MVEGRIYEGFPSRADESRMQAFHAANWIARAEIAETIENDRYRELARRLVFVNAPEALPGNQRSQLQTWLENRRHGREGVEAGRTIADALADLEQAEMGRPKEGGSIAAIRRWFEAF